MLILFGLAGLLARGPDVEVLAGMGLLIVFVVYEKFLALSHARHYVDEFIPVEEDFIPIKSYAR